MLTSRMFTGFMLIGIGAIFLASQLGLITLDPGELAATYWPVALILFGLSGMFGHSGRSGGSSRFWSGFLVLLGVFFLLNNLDLIEMSLGDLIRMLIPVLIILYGIRMLMKPAREKTPQDHSYKYEYKYEYNPAMPGEATGKGEGAASVPPPPGAAAHGDIPPPPGQGGAARSGGSWQADERSGFFGDIYLGQDYWELKPMNVSHFFGDVIVDLTKARVPAGETKLHISSFIGDVKVFVPNDLDLEVSVHTSSVIGDITIYRRRESGFLRSISEEPANYQLAEKRIRLEINLFFGDVNVQKVG